MCVRAPVYNVHINMSIYFRAHPAVAPQLFQMFLLCHNLYTPWGVQNMWSTPALSGCRHQCNVCFTVGGHFWGVAPSLWPPMAPIWNFNNQRAGSVNERGLTSSSSVSREWDSLCGAVIGVQRPFGHTAKPPPCESCWTLLKYVGDVTGSIISK